MPANDAGEKTEEATPKKLNDARYKGNVPKSRDLSGAVELIGAIVMLKLGGWFMAEYMYGFTNRLLTFDMPYRPIPYGKEILPYALDWMVWIVIILAPFMFLICIVAAAANIYQVGFLFATEPLKLNFNKLNPVSGMKRIFSAKNIMMLVMNIAKLCIIMPVAWNTIINELETIMIMLDMETPGTFTYMTDVVLDLALKLAIILFILGYADFWYQKRNYLKEMRMTKQEVKEEYKQMEGDPKVKQKRRQIQMQQAMERMMNEVPQAEVVVRNPTHFAVAVSYKPEMPAPVVVAKGKDKVAERIIAAAREARVPLYEDPPLARELYRTVEVGEQIPTHLYEAMAKIIESVMSAEKREAMRRHLEQTAV